MSAPQTDSPLAERVLACMMEAVIHADRQGLIALWNPAAETMFGFSTAEAIGQSLDIIIPERLREAHWRGFHAAIASGRTRLNGRPTVTRALHKSGATLYVEMSFAMVCATSGEVIGSVAVARDATERVQREKAARSAGAG
ncbi:MAG TPA: PAS domain S-box protein [Azonexus sp.]|jgi:PAS domain S-box-containing protein|nr:PAS domain S-box protein [Azonexus sp.]